MTTGRIETVPVPVNGFVADSSDTAPVLEITELPPPALAVSMPVVVITGAPEAPTPPPEDDSTTSGELMVPLL